tara:strand:+ start:1293 stop:1544 length:252 start_codon:yes stop_codon:yes gene_type:complete
MNTLISDMNALISERLAAVVKMHKEGTDELWDLRWAYCLKDSPVRTDLAGRLDFLESHVDSLQQLILDYRMQDKSFKLSTASF